MHHWGSEGHNQKYLAHTNTYIDIGEIRSSLERHCETIPAQSKPKLN